MTSMVNYLDFETISSCNRFCPTCIRNSHPDREAVKSWFEVNYLPIAVIKEALDQAVEMDFHGGVCLSHYNEPLMDQRIPDIAAMVKAYGRFSPIFLNTNGDYLTEELAAALDGKLDHIIVTLYMKEPIKSERAAWLPTIFHQTEVRVITMSEHIATHFSPAFDVMELAKKHGGHPCSEPAMRIIINHRQQYLLCCDDVVGNFGLGNFPDIPLAEHWKKRQQIIEILAQQGGRQWHPYCISCPRV